MGLQRQGHGGSPETLISSHEIVFLPGRSAVFEPCTVASPANVAGRCLPAVCAFWMGSLCAAARFRLIQAASVPRALIILPPESRALFECPIVLSPSRAFLESQSGVRRRCSRNRLNPDSCSLQLLRACTGRVWQSCNSCTWEW